MPLEKACVKVLEGCNAGGVSFNKDEKIFVQFNPEKYSVSANARYSFASKDGKLYGQYSGEDSRTLTVELFFDMLSLSAVFKNKTPKAPGSTAPALETLMDEAGAVSSAYINKLMALTKAGKEKGAPPMVEFMWGGVSLRGVITTAILNYTLFNSKGEPTRATLNLTFKECDDVMKADKNERMKLDSSGSGAAVSLPAAGDAMAELEIKESIIKALKLL